MGMLHDNIPLFFIIGVLFMTNTTKYLYNVTQRIIFEDKTMKYLGSNECILDNDMFNNMIICLIREKFSRKKEYKLYDLNNNKYLKSEQKKFFDSLKSCDNSKVMNCFKDSEYLSKDFQEFICFYTIAYTQYLIDKLFKNTNLC